VPGEDLERLIRRDSHRALRGDETRAVERSLDDGAGERRTGEPRDREDEPGGQDEYREAAAHQPRASPA